MQLAIDRLRQAGSAWQGRLAALLVVALVQGCKQRTPQEVCAQSVQQISEAIANGTQNFNVASWLLVIALVAVLLADLYRLRPLKYISVACWVVFWLMAISSAIAKHQSMGTCSPQGQLLLIDGMPWSWVDYAVIAGGLILVFALQPVALGHGEWLAGVVEGRQEAIKAAREQAQFRRMAREEAERVKEQDLINRRRNVAAQLTGIENALRAMDEVQPFQVKRQINQALDRISEDLEKSPRVLTEEIRQRAVIAGTSLEKLGVMDESFRKRWQQLFERRI